ncbi:MAG: glycosyltransferase [Lachnospiraceae bacterium]|nr:glycosyltransferase [Lachnospiraceae bacterium]
MRQKKKKVLFVINTMGRAGAEIALLELLRRIDKSEYDVSLYVLTGQGELIDRIPEGVKLVNKTVDTNSVHDSLGRKHLAKKVSRALLKEANGLKLMPYFVKNGAVMLKNKQILLEKLLWRPIADAAVRPKRKYDVAVSYIEGAAAYYVADHVEADRRVAFIHVDYEKAGYTRELDRDCYLKFDKIFGVSDEVAAVFKKVYPEISDKIGVFHNLLNNEAIIEKAETGEGFSDGFKGVRILTVGRLMKQKGFEVSIRAAKMLKEHGENIRWYVLGEGDQRSKLESLIQELGLQNDFVLLGAVDNPYPYIKEADLYVHCSRFEGKSIAIQEAQILGKPIIVSDCSGNREQVNHGEDGLTCAFDSKSIAKSIKELIEDKGLRERLGKNALKRNMNNGEEVKKIFVD